MRCFQMITGFVACRLQTYDFFTIESLDPGGNVGGRHRAAELLELFATQVMHDRLILSEKTIRGIIANQAPVVDRAGPEIGRAHV